LERGFRRAWRFPKVWKGGFVAHRSFHKFGKEVRRAQKFRASRRRSQE
jgi:hypothetical protein